MIDNPIVIGLGATAATVVGAALYSYLTGDSAGADIDGDGDADVTFRDGASDIDVDLDGEKTDEPPSVVLSKDDVTQVKGIGDTRKEALIKDGFEAVTDLYYADDSALTDVEGIGEYTVGQIRDDIGGIDTDE